MCVTNHVKLKNNRPQTEKQQKQQKKLTKIIDCYLIVLYVYKKSTPMSALCNTKTKHLVDNRSKRRREKSRMLQDFSSFAVQYRVRANHKISPQLALSAFQFLSSSVDPFHPNWISENVLRRLVQQGPVIQFIRFNRNSNKSTNGKCDPDCDSTLPDVNFIYQQVSIDIRTLIEL